MSLWLARHAPVLLETGRCYGAMDVAADTAATLEAAGRLAGLLPVGLRVRCSPLRRCVQLAQQLQVLRADLVWQCDARLVEMNFGTWEGVPWRDIPRPAFDAWMQDFPWHRFGGVESVNEMLQRVASVWDTRYRGSDGAGEVWVTHAGVVRCVALLAQGRRRVAQASDWPQDGLDLGGCCRVSDAGLQGSEVATARG